MHKPDNNTIANLQFYDAAYDETSEIRSPRSASGRKYECDQNVVTFPMNFLNFKAQGVLSILPYHKLNILIR